MGIKNRIDNLEKQTGADKPSPYWIVVVYDDTGKPSEAALEKAKAECKAKHPDWEESLSESDSSMTICRKCGIGVSHHHS